MGRKQKPIEEKKVKVSISLDRELYLLIKQEKLMPSRLIETLLKNRYGKKDL